MQINHIQIDDCLIEEAMQATGFYDKKTLFLESLRALIALKQPISKKNDISTLFGIVKTPLSATLEEIEQSIIDGAVNDSH